MFQAFFLLIALSNCEEFQVIFENDEWKQFQTSNLQFEYKIEFIQKKQLYIDITMNEINDQFYLIYSYTQLANINSQFSYSLQYDQISIIDQRNTRFLKIMVQNSPLYIYVLDKYQTTNYLIKIKQSDEEICEGACFSRGDCSIDGCNCYIKEEGNFNYVGNNCNRQAQQIENKIQVQLDSDRDVYFYSKSKNKTITIQYENEGDNCLQISQIPSNNIQTSFDFKICKDSTFILTSDIELSDNLIFKVKQLSTIGNNLLSITILNGDTDQSSTITNGIYVIIVESIFLFLIVAALCILVWKYKTLILLPEKINIKKEKCEICREEIKFSTNFQFFSCFK